jgi:hypothetical protein
MNWIGVFVTRTATCQVSPEDSFIACFGWMYGIPCSFCLQCKSCFYQTGKNQNTSPENQEGKDDSYSRTIRIVSHCELHGSVNSWVEYKAEQNFVMMCVAMPSQNNMKRKLCIKYVQQQWAKAVSRVSSGTLHDPWHILPFTIYREIRMICKNIWVTGMKRTA